MSVKRSFPGAFGLGSAEDAGQSPSKMAATEWADYSQYPSAMDAGTGYGSMFYGEYPTPAKAPVKKTASFHGPQGGAGPMQTDYHSAGYSYDYGHGEVEYGGAYGKGYDQTSAAYGSYGMEESTSQGYGTSAQFAPAQNPRAGMRGQGQGRGQGPTRGQPGGRGRGQAGGVSFGGYPIEDQGHTGFGAVPKPMGRGQGRGAASRGQLSQGRGRGSQGNGNVGAQNSDLTYSGYYNATREAKQETGGYGETYDESYGSAYSGYDTGYSGYDTAYTGSYADSTYEDQSYQDPYVQYDTSGAYGARGRGLGNQMGRGRGQDNQMSRGRGQGNQTGRGRGSATGGFGAENQANQRGAFGNQRSRGGNQMGRGGNQMGRGGNQMGRGVNQMGRGGFQFGGSEAGNQMSRGRGRGDGMARGRGDGMARGRGRGDGMSRGRGRGNDMNRGRSSEMGGRGRGDGMGRGRGRGDGMGRGRGRGDGMSRGGGRGDGMSRGRGRGYEMGRGRGRGDGMGRGRGRGDGMGRGRGRGGGAGGFPYRAEGLEDYGNAPAHVIQQVSDAIMGLVNIQPAANANQLTQPGGLPRIPPGSNLTQEELKTFQGFKEFLEIFPEKVNAMMTLTNGLAASPSKPELIFTTELLRNNIMPFFTGQLTLGKVFITRCVATNKKSAKHVCFQKGLEILKNNSLAEILTLKDCGTQALQKKVTYFSEALTAAFVKFVNKKLKAQEDELKEEIRQAAMNEAQTRSHNQLSLEDKIDKFTNELKKRQPGEEVSIAHCDSACSRAGIMVSILFRLLEPIEKEIRPKPGMNLDSAGDMSLRCEVYFDDILVGQGVGKPRTMAKKEAYANLVQRLFSCSAAEFATGPSIPKAPEQLPDIYMAFQKGNSNNEGDNKQCLMTQRNYPPDFELTESDMVLIEMPSETVAENPYKILEMSASLCSMFLQWSYPYRNEQSPSQRFTCQITLNNKKKAFGKGASKANAKNEAAAAILADLYKTQDVIVKKADDREDAIPMEELEARAAELQAEGPPRAERLEMPWMNDVAQMSPDQVKTNTQAQAASTWLHSWLNNPLRPWIEDAVEEKLELYSNKLTLEDLQFGPITEQGLLSFIHASARKNLLVRRNMSNPTYITLHHRGITPKEMVKILHVNGKKSGRYELARANKPFTSVQRAQFVRNFHQEWRPRAQALAEAETLLRSKQPQANNGLGAHTSTEKTQR